MSDNQEIKFGTDGWRGIIGDDYNFRNLRILSQAVAEYIGQGKSVVVGFDTRFMSEQFAQVVSQALENSGIKVLLSDRAVPTPALSFTVKNRSVDLGIMITASHNPAEYNGFKIKMPSGGAAGPDVTGAVEALIAREAAHGASEAQAGETVRENISRDYVKFIRSYIDLKKIKNKKFKVLVDAMYGSGNSFIAEVLKGTNIKVEFLRNTVNPSFGGRRPEPVEENLEELKARVKKDRFDLGIALDGDADRIAAVAGGGIFIHPQKILGLLALHLNQDRRWSGGIVKTICGTAMIDRIAEYLKVRIFQTPVGFKYISNLMETEDILVGGEEAGGIGFKGYIPERDGMVAGLLLIEMMVYRNKNILAILNEMEKRFGKFYYLRDDVRLANKIQLRREKFPQELLGKKVVQIMDFDGIKMICEDSSWLMLRSSGTEPIVRIYAESTSLKKSRSLIALGRDILSQQ